ncbi:MAG TPA: glycoside hydrolase family 3 C-terminal domain-containing protein [Acetobacteraceae bacterium]|nr:glycoside hydrolase family 3 C-terminal domain-containing protein [Acetobacteraceae bacterium]
MEDRLPAEAPARAGLAALPSPRPLLLALFLCLPWLAPGALAGQAQPACPWLDPHLPVARRVAMVMRNMTPQERFRLIRGGGLHQPYVFYIPGLPRLCLPPFGLEDGPSGVGDKLRGVTALPAGVALAASWDPALARRYGQVIGAEQKAKGAAVDLGPTVNIDRDPRWGRSFESFSEDPYLSARIGEAEIGGIQSRGVMAQVKHFAVYNQETARNTPADDAIISARALHEIYLPAFRAAIRRADVASVMCAYSSVNGAYSCQNRNLLTGILRREWGFRGFVTSDYAAVHAASAARAGTDMEQPSGRYFGKPLKSGIARGRISPAVIETMNERILTELFRFGIPGRPPSGSPDAMAASPRHARIAERVAEAGTVLLKNDGVLPLAARGGSIAVIGPAAAIAPVYGGGGSAYVIPSNPVTPLRGIEAAASSRKIIYEPGLPADNRLGPIPPQALSIPFRETAQNGRYEAVLTAPETGIYVLALTNPCRCYAPADLLLDGRELLADPGTPPVSTYSAAVHLRAHHRYRLEVNGAASRLAWATPSSLAPYIAKAASAARAASTAIVVVSDDTESEAADRPNLSLPSAQDELIRAVAAANPHTILVIDAGAPVAMPWLDQAAAILDAWYPGEANGTALGRILFGRADPGGHLPVTFPRGLAQLPTAAAQRFPGTGGRVLYGEGIDVGYRWYESRHIKPLFPFGFGLSYTRFRFSRLRIRPRHPDGTTPVTVEAVITNTGKMSGSDVAQLYLGLPEANGEPPRRLVGFRRVALAPGQSENLRFVIRPRQEWWWYHSGWNQTAGRYRVYLGDSSASSGLPLRGAFVMVKTIGARRVEIASPTRFQPGKPGMVRLTLTAGGSETLRPGWSLEVPEDWTVKPLGAEPAGPLRPDATGIARFRVTPPSWAAPGDYTLRGTASLGGRNAVRSAGILIRLLPARKGGK